VKQAQVRKRTERDSGEKHLNFAVIEKAPDSSSSNSTDSSEGNQASTTTGEASASSSSSSEGDQATHVKGGNLARYIDFNGYQNIWYDTECVFHARSVGMTLGSNTWVFDEEELQLLCEVPPPSGSYDFYLTSPSGPSVCAQALMELTYIYFGATYFLVDPNQADVKTNSYPLSLYDVAYLCAGAADEPKPYDFQAKCVYDNLINFNYNVDDAFKYCKQEAYTQFYTSSASHLEPFGGILSTLKNSLF